jgi:hypothetical protein
MALKSGTLIRDKIVQDETFARSAIVKQVIQKWLYFPPGILC